MSNTELAGLNSATLGAKMPEVTLPDGTVVQTGTIGALLVNIKAYNEAHATDDQDKMAQLQTAISSSLPLLKKVGFFELFTPEEWIQGNNEGRRLVGRFVLQSA